MQFLRISVTLVRPQSANEMPPLLLTGQWEGICRETGAPPDHLLCPHPDINNQPAHAPHARIWARSYARESAHWTDVRSWLWWARVSESLIYSYAVISHYNILRSLIRITEKHLISHSGLNGNKYFDELSQTTTGGWGRGRVNNRVIMANQTSLHF